MQEKLCLAWKNAKEWLADSAVSSSSKNNNEEAGRTRAEHADRAEVVVRQQAVDGERLLGRHQAAANKVGVGGADRERRVERAVPDDGHVGAGAGPLRRVDERLGELGARAANHDLRPTCGEWE